MIHCKLYDSWWVIFIVIWVLHNSYFCHDSWSWFILVIWVIVSHMSHGESFGHVESNWLNSLTLVVHSWKLSPSLQEVMVMSVCIMKNPPPLLFLLSPSFSSSFSFSSSITSLQISGDVDFSGNISFLPNREFLHHTGWLPSVRD